MLPERGGYLMGAGVVGPTTNDDWNSIDMPQTREPGPRSASPPSAADGDICGIDKE